MKKIVLLAIVLISYVGLTYSLQEVGTEEVKEVKVDREKEVRRERLRSALDRLERILSEEKK